MGRKYIFYLIRTHRNKLQRVRLGGHAGQPTGSPLPAQLFVRLLFKLVLISLNGAEEHNSADKYSLQTAAWGVGADGDSAYSVGRTSSILICETIKAYNTFSWSCNLGIAFELCIASGVCSSDRSPARALLLSCWQHSWCQKYIR